MRFCELRYQSRECRFAGSCGAKEKARRRAVGFDGATQGRAIGDKMALASVLIEIARAHSCSEGQVARE
jgi:hypothetical protein